mmetsp:Transcript_3554/g.15646  ORF Transcript_3554/g.15646 Transcript_3554/m.15646 type:complete len:390 (-) Transcript_3554:2018-3187(-)
MRTADVRAMISPRMCGAGEVGVTARGSSPAAPRSWARPPSRACPPPPPSAPPSAPPRRGATPPSAARASAPPFGAPHPPARTGGAILSRPTAPPSARPTPRSRRRWSSGTPSSPICCTSRSMAPPPRLSRSPNRRSRSPRRLRSPGIRPPPRMGPAPSTRSGRRARRATGRPSTPIPATRWRPSARSGTPSTIRSIPPSRSPMISTRSGGGWTGRRPPRRATCSTRKPSARPWTATPAGSSSSTRSTASVTASAPSPPPSSSPTRRAASSSSSGSATIPSTRQSPPCSPRPSSGTRTSSRSGPNGSTLPRRSSPRGRPAARVATDPCSPRCTTPPPTGVSPTSARFSATQIPGSTAPCTSSRRTPSFSSTRRSTTSCPAPWRTSSRPRR